VAQRPALAAESPQQLIPAPASFDCVKIIHSGYLNYILTIGYGQDMMFHDPDNNQADEFGYKRGGMFGSGGILGWIGRSLQRSTERKARRWLYWNVPFMRSFVRYRQSGPLGRLGCVIQLLIQVAFLTISVLVMLQITGISAQLESLLPR
jgi:hypothetical protein